MMNSARPLCHLVGEPAARRKARVRPVSAAHNERRTLPLASQVRMDVLHERPARTSLEAVGTKIIP